MNRPDFTALLADIREAFAPEPAIYLTDDEAQVADEMMLAARALYAAYPREEVVPSVTRRARSGRSAVRLTK